MSLWADCEGQLLIRETIKRTEKFGLMETISCLTTFPLYYMIIYVNKVMEKPTLCIIIKFILVAYIHHLTMSIEGQEVIIKTFFYTLQVNCISISVYVTQI